MKRALAIAAVSLAPFACNHDTSFKLPSRPEADLAFAVLYDAAGAAADIGPVVRQSQLYGGGYHVESEQSGLTARLFFLKLADLSSAITTSCGGLDDAAKRRACLDQITSCASTPNACLLAVRSEQGCGDRVKLSAELPLLAYTTGEDGELQPLGNDVRPEGLDLCGPQSSPPCPLYIPGFTVTEAGSFRCVAPVAQLGCDVRIDLSRCGLDTVTAHVTEAGALEDTKGNCAAEPLVPGEGPLGSNEGQALVCGDRRLVASTMGLYFGDAICPRHGPGNFDARRGTTGSGIVSGALVRETRTGGAPQLIMTGDGSDQCTEAGCSSRGGSCDTDCSELCASVFQIDVCASNDWARCSGLSAQTECIKRCEAWCGRAPGAGCYDDTGGAMLTYGSSTQPEITDRRVVLNRESYAATSPGEGLAVLDDDRVLVANRGSLTLLSLGARPDDTVELARVSLPSIELAGVLHMGGEDAVVYGVDFAGLPRIERFQVTADALPVHTPIAPPAIRSVDLAARLGESGDRFVIASTRTPSGEASELHFVTLSGGAGGSVTVPGSVASMITLPSGAVLVGVVSNGTTHSLVRLEPDGSGGAIQKNISLIGGLEPTALGLDVSSCEGNRPSACRVFIGLVRRQRAGPALVGVALDDSSNLRVLPALLETGSLELDLFAPSSDRLLAIAARLNTLTPITLER